MYQKEEASEHRGSSELKSQRTTQGKIVIELDPECLENAVLTVLKSERGREILREGPMK